MIKLNPTLNGTQVAEAIKLLMRYVKDPEFWELFKKETINTNLSHHDILENDAEIFNHIRFMFNCDLNIEIVSYKTRYPFSSVIGYAEGNRVYENTRKINSLTIHERVGHLGHEICHLFGYRHEYQGQKTSASVVFGQVMEKYSSMQ
jgi:hypothetical protein